MLELAGLELLSSLNLDLAVLSLAFLPIKQNKGERKGVSESLILTYLKCFSVPAVSIEFVRHLLGKFLIRSVKKNVCLVFHKPDFSF